MDPDFPARLEPGRHGRSGPDVVFGLFSRCVDASKGRYLDPFSFIFSFDLGLYLYLDFVLLALSNPPSTRERAKYEAEGEVQADGDGDEEEEGSLPGGTLRVSPTRPVQQSGRGATEKCMKLPVPTRCHTLGG
ncbi:MAG: hypothetical protein R6U63_03035 [Longimicrobiales bacterium]